MSSHNTSWLTVTSAATDVVEVEKTLESGPITIAEYVRDFILGLSSLIYKHKVNIVHSINHITFCTAVVFIAASNDRVAVGLYWGKFLYR